MFTFQQDDAPAHRARKTIRLLQRETTDLFCPTMATQQPRPKSSRLHGVGSDRASYLPEQSEHCQRTEGMLKLQYGPISDKILLVCRSLSAVRVKHSCYGPVN